MPQIGEASRSGGWKGSPNSLAALVPYQGLIATRPRCSRCRRPALSGTSVCASHAGRASPHSSGAGRGESRMLARLERLGLLPLELLALPVWRGLAGLETRTRAPLRLQLVQAWDRRQDQPLRWAQVQRNALDQGARPGKRAATAWYYENR